MENGRVERFVDRYLEVYLKKGFWAVYEHRNGEENGEKDLAYEVVRAMEGIFRMRSPSERFGYSKDERRLIIEVVRGGDLL